MSSMTESKVYSIHLQPFSWNHPLESSILGIFFLFLSIGLPHFFQVKNESKLSIISLSSIGFTWAKKRIMFFHFIFLIEITHRDFPNHYASSNVKVNTQLTCKSKYIVIYFAPRIGKFPRVFLSNVIVVCLLT